MIIIPLFIGIDEGVKMRTVLREKIKLMSTMGIVLMVGIVSAGTGLGTLVVPPIANWLISNYDWRASYTIVGISALVMLVLAAQFLKRDPSYLG